MAKQLFSNAASALLAASIDDDDLSIQVDAGYGQYFPNPGAGEFFLVTLQNADGDLEIVKITSRSTDILTVDASGRGQEGTTAQAWTNGLTRVEVRVTKGTLDRFLQREGGIMEGPLDMDNNNIVDAALTGTWKGTNGQLVGTKLRGTLDDDSNEIDVPASGPATSGGAVILTEGDVERTRETAFEVGMLMLWFGAAVDCPDGWAICDGNNGTPDMRDRVAVGVSATKDLDDTGGAETASGNTELDGGHTHGSGVTGTTTLTTAQIPAHHHEVHGSQSTGASEFCAGLQSTAERGLAAMVGGSAGAMEDTANGNQIIKDEGGSQGHNHSITAVNSHSHALTNVSVMQPYRALHYIMYIGY